MDQFRAVIADDHPMCCEAARVAILAAVPNAVIDITETLGDALACAGNADLVVFDLSLPDSRGVAGLIDIARTFPNARIVVVTGSEHPGIERQVAACAAAGFVAKAAPIGDLIAAIRAVVAGGEWFSDAVDRDEPSGDAVFDRMASLTVAESRVLRAMRDGALNKQIAFQLGLSEITVKQHVKAILRKLGVVNRTQAILMLRSLGDDPAPSGPDPKG